MKSILLSNFNTTYKFAEETGIPRRKGADALDVRDQAIIPISVFTASGDMTRLKSALNAGLVNGLSVNEIKEILVQLYAYCGFPRSLNGISAFMDVMKDRESRGIKDKMGKEVISLPEDMDRDTYGAEVRRKLMGVKEELPAQGYQLFVPVIDTYLKEHLFADVFARDVLDHRQRELVTISALAAMHGTEGQLKFHFGAAMNVGMTISQMNAFIIILAAHVGRSETQITEQILSDVVQERLRASEKMIGG